MEKHSITVKSTTNIDKSSVESHALCFPKRKRDRKTRKQIQFVEVNHILSADK